MPSSRHLQWVELREFGSLWTSSDRFLMPANGAQIMSGCHPQLGGGLRAFFKPIVVMDTLGMPSETTNTITGATVIRHHDGYPFMLAITHNTVPSGVPDGGDIYENVQLWCRGNLIDTSPIDPEERWRLITSGNTFDGTDEDEGNGATPNKRQHSFAIIPAATLGVSPAIFFTLNIGSTVGGLWQVTNAGVGTASLPQLARTTFATEDARQTNLGPIISHQARLVFATSDGISFSDPGGGNIPTGIGTDTKWIQLSAKGYDPPDSYPAWMLAVPPSDLLVGTIRGEVYVIQGDLADPAIRELGRWGGTISHQPVNTAYGPIVIFPNSGPTVFGLDGQTQPLAVQLDESIWTVDPVETGFGTLDFSNDFLFAPNQHDSDDLSVATTLNNGALVYDFRTRAWFTSAHPEAAELPCPRWIFAENIMQEGGVLVMSGRPIEPDTLQPLVYRFGTTSGVDSVRRRASIWEWQSAPLRSPDGRRVEVRELHFGTSGFGIAGTLEVTLTSDTGETQTRTIDVAEGRNTTIVAARLAGEYVDVTIKSKSNDDDVEAPMLDSLNIGWTPRQAQRFRQSGGYLHGYSTGF